MKNRRNNTTKLVLACIALLAFGQLHTRAANTNNTGNGNKVGGTNPTPTAGCSPAVALASLEFNNVRARIDATGGSMFQDRANSIAAYNVPKQNSENDPLYTALYAGSLWIGGVDAAGQLKVAAVTFRSGGNNDFWPGPLDNTAEVDANTCEVFDQFFGISRPMVNEYFSWFADPSSNPDYQIPAAILNYPARGNTVKKKQYAYYVADELAPFVDADGDTYYDPTKGDYPWYDLKGTNDCRTNREVPLFGDTTLWFVFNDKGNTHTESQGLSIGMEIRGQAFAFATNDEINNMTFYNYVLINRSNFTFQNTYFGQWIDADLGFSDDDFVGCDASRGLGYCYNGDANDEDGNGVTGYGTTPPFIGVDFFEGPYMDDDGMDNPLTEDIPTAIAQNGIPYAGLGIGYGDGIIDNERYGMRKFVYYNRGAVINGNGDPRNAVDIYNYLQGIWLDGVGGVTWGGDGNPSSTGGAISADLMFPGNSDPLFWSTKGQPVPPGTENWTEDEVNNTPADRRFIQSAGPFELKPGAVNNITVGVVFARALSGDNLSSLTYLQVADDKAQALFDNCFRILEGPNAPDVTIQELENELILFLSNNNPISNNYKESADLKDPFISIPDTLDGVYQGNDSIKDLLKYYKFQGYQVYQIKNTNVSVTQLSDPSVSRLIAQVDIKDNIGQIVNYTYDASINANVPKEMVNGKNAGINHSFRVTDDAFATGTNKKLVNHKTYHFIAIAYAYNNWKTVDPQLFAAGGQLKPYLASRTSSTGGGIRSYSGIPHSPKPTNGGTVVHSDYGDMPEITRIEGAGNGGLVLELTSASEAQIVSNSFMDYPVYQAGYGPLEVKVVDPLNVKKGTYYLQFLDSTTAPVGVNSLDDAYWRVINGSDTTYSERNINFRNEQLFSNLGFSVTLSQTTPSGIETGVGENNGFISSTISYANPLKTWLSGAFDTDARNDLNWIRSGIQSFYQLGPPLVSKDYDDYGDFNLIDSVTAFYDPEQKFENMLGGTWAPYRLVSNVMSHTKNPDYPLGTNPLYFDLTSTNKLPISNGLCIVDRFSFAGGTKAKIISTHFKNKQTLYDLQSVDIVFTNDQSKWTRCVVFETGNDTSLTEGNVSIFGKRAANNVDKNGNADGTLNPLGAVGNGMGWFPGYAVNVETGERLNMAFGEDSRYINFNGRDMKWNPTADYFKWDSINMVLDTVAGARHYTYVFNTRYDGCKILDSLLSVSRVSASPLAPAIVRKTVDYIGTTAMWAGFPIVQFGQSLLSSDARIKIRVTTPYKTFTTANTANPTSFGNSQRPMYMFSMDAYAVETGVASAAKEVLDMIKAVPNPYYAYSEYENDKFDNRIKITNLPEACTISIYNVGGTLMRRYIKGDSKTSLDWDLKNSSGIPVAGGVYLIHVEIPEVGETVIKWFGVARPTDLNGL